MFKNTAFKNYNGKIYDRQKKVIIFIINLTICDFLNVGQICTAEIPYEEQNENQIQIEKPPEIIEENRRNHSHDGQCSNRKRVSIKNGIVLYSQSIEIQRP